MSSETEVGLNPWSDGAGRVCGGARLFPDSPGMLGGESEDAGEAESVGVELRECGLSAARAARERGWGASPLPIMWLASAWLRLESEARELSVLAISAAGGQRKSIKARRSWAYLATWRQGDSPPV